MVIHIVSTHRDLFPKYTKSGFLGTSVHAAASSISVKLNDFLNKLHKHCDDIRIYASVVYPVRGEGGWQSCTPFDDQVA